MNKIEEYINSIYGNFDNLDKDTKILKEETRTHLQEEVEEFKKQGLSEDESITRVLDNFGKEDMVVDEMNNILRKRSILAKMLIKAGLAIFIFGCLFQIIGLFYSDEGFKHFGIILSDSNFKKISFLLVMVSLAIWNIAFYYYYFNKARDIVFLVFVCCDFVLCMPIYFVWSYYPSHMLESLLFIFGATFLIAFLIRIYYDKRKKIN